MRCRVDEGRKVCSALGALAGRFRASYPGAALAPPNQVTGGAAERLGISFPFCPPSRFLYRQTTHKDERSLAVFFVFSFASVERRFSLTLFVVWGHDTVAAYACCVTERLPWSTPGRNCANTVRKPTLRFPIMNLSLVDPFALAQDYPDKLTATLSMSFCQLSRSSGC
jgi:hypothetical protein